MAESNRAMENIEEEEDSYGHEIPEVYLHSYRQDRPLKRGASGDIFSYRVRKDISIRLPKDVIVKKIVKATDNEKYRNWEQDIYKKISLHDNIVRLYIIEETNIFLLIVMERCLGTLDEYCHTVRTERQFTIGETRFLCQQIAQGLVYLHQNNIIHRDMKPGKVLYKVKQGIIGLKIAGFSFSRPNAPGIKTALGTESYMSPELLNARYVSMVSPPVADYDGEASDIFSTGVVFYEIFVNEALFGHLEQREEYILREIIAGFSAISHGDSPLHTPQNSVIPDNEFRELLTLMLQWNPNDRIKSMDLLNHPFFTHIDGARRRYLNDKGADELKHKIGENYPKGQWGINLELYEMKYAIGRGFFGSVFAYRLKNKKNESDKYPLEVSVKTVMILSGKDMREIEILSRLKHANIVHVFGALWDKGLINITMELAQCNLKNFHERWGAFKATEVSFLGKQIACGFNHLHSLNIAHRDVKPHNILVMYKEEKDLFDKGDLSRATIKLADFGLSRYIQGDSLSSVSAVGTPRYMAPEVTRALVRDDKSFHGSYMKADVFSTGVVIHQLITDEFPFTRSELESEFGSPDLPDLLKNATPVLADLVRAMLEWNPDTRIGVTEVYERFCGMSKDM